MGSLAGRSLDHVYGEDQEWAREFYTDSYVKYGLEKFSQITRRVRDGLHSISTRHPDGNVIVVTHHHPVKSAVALAKGVDPASLRGFTVGNGSVTLVAVRDGAMNLLPSEDLRVP